MENSAGSGRSVVGIAALVVLYLAAVFGVWRVADSNARYKTEESLNYARKDCAITLESFFDGLMALEGRNAMKILKRPSARTVAEMREIVDACGLDELTVADRTGRVIAASDPSVQGKDLAADPSTVAFLALTNAAAESVLQTFRPTMGGGRGRRFYSGFPFRDGAFLVCGYNETSAAWYFAHRTGRLMENWQFGESGCYLVADARTNRIRYDVHGFGGKGRTLREVGLGCVLDLPDDAAKTRVATVFGERCFFRSFRYLGERLIAIMPRREFYATARNTTVTTSLALLLVFAIFGFASNRTRAANRAIVELHAAEEAKRLKDMAMATSIQKHSLPSNFPPYPDLADSFDIYASMNTAKEVGGDFYDFYFIGPDRVALVMADVSGKGIPAAMFMMRAKATLQGLLKGGADLVTAVSETNDRLCAGNADGMFVTAWVGIYDIRSCRLEFVNAGHNPPVVRSGVSAPRWIREKSGLPLAAMEGVRYRPHALELAPRDFLVLYTDGVTEAQDVSRELYGEDRLGACLANLGGGETCESVCRRILADVTAFAGAAEQADDITILALQVKKPVSAPSPGPAERM